MKSLRTLAFLSAVACVAAAHAQLGVAGEFNEYVLGNANQSNSDVEGNVAIGGTATFSSESINADNLSEAGYSAVVGSSFSGTSGTLYGNLYAGGSVSSSSWNFDGNVVSGGQGSAPVNFAATNSYITGYSTFLASLTANGSAVNSFSTLTLSGTSSTLDVIDITASQLSNGVSGIVINAPAAATVLINVSGSSAALPNVGYTFAGGTSAGHVLYNFYNATSLTFNGLNGSVLAPNAAATFAYGAANGTIIVGSLSGGGQVNNDPFDGVLPPTPSPEPITLAMPVVLAGAWLRRRAKASRA